MAARDNLWKVAVAGAALVIAIIMPLITEGPFILHVFFNIWLQIILVCSLRVIFLTGQMSGAHPAFMAIGAYTTALLTTRFGVPFCLTIFVGIGIALLVAAIIGSVTLRLKHVYFLLATVAFVETVRLLLSNWFTNVFGGISGLTNIPHANISIPYLFKVTIVSKVQYYYFGLIVMLLSLFFLHRLEASRYGQIFKAIKQSDALVKSIGINVFRYRLFAFAIGSAFAAVAGSLFAPFNRLICPAEFGMREGMLMFVYMIVGGLGSFYGPIIGTSFLILFSMFIMSRLGPYEFLFYGCILIVMLIFMPKGLVSLPSYMASFQRSLSKRGEE